MQFDLAEPNNHLPMIGLAKGLKDPLFNYLQDLWFESQAFYNFWIQVKLIKGYLVEYNYSPSMLVQFS